MVQDYFHSADSELPVVPQEGCLRFLTEPGIIGLEPGEIAIIPRGLVHRVEVPGACAGLRLRKPRPDVRTSLQGPCRRERHGQSAPIRMSQHDRTVTTKRRCAAQSERQPYKSRPRAD